MALRSRSAQARGPVVGVVGWRQTTNEAIVEAWRALGIPALLVEPDDALAQLAPGDTAVGRLDVLRTLDGVEPGLDCLDELSARGIRVLNTAGALLAAHDKLITMARLNEAGLPHPATMHVLRSGSPAGIAPPVVVKPRFGSWGADVLRCDSATDLERTLVSIADRPWFQKHGALVQELVPPVGFDLRLVIAAGQVVGATERVALPGEWRTNTALGATRRPASPSAAAEMLGIRAAAAIGADLVGVDLLPTSSGYVVLELNGAVEFDNAYDLGPSDAYEAAAVALELTRRRGVSSDRAAIPAGAPQREIPRRG